MKASEYSKIIAVKPRRVLARITGSPANVRFRDMISLVEAFGFRLTRVAGSHHIFVHSGIQELVNLQEVNGEAKPYQVRQFLKLVERHDLSLGDR